MIVYNRPTYISYLFKKLIWIAIFVFLFVFNTTASVITVQPQSQAKCMAEGQGLFTVEVSSTVTLSQIQWFYLNKGMPQLIGYGPSCNAAMAGDYFCFVLYKDAQGHAQTEQSQIATLTINTAPTIEQIIVPGVCEGSTLTATLNIANDGGLPITQYEWKIDGVTVGTNSDVLEIQNIPGTQNNKLLQLTAYNGCDDGNGVIKQSITVYETPKPPTFITPTYCQGDVAKPLEITESNKANWFSQSTGGSLATAPVPDTSIPGTPQIWWVSQTIVRGNTSCESPRTQAVVVVTERSELPVAETFLEYCKDVAPAPVLTATGDNLQWYSQTRPLPAAPTITTATAGTQIYYVTQKQALKCESNKLTITVNIKDAANQQDITIFPDNSKLCPYNKTTLQATAPVENPVFRWYDDSKKTILLHTGSTFETPELISSKSYYVSLEYPGYCESTHLRPVLITVEDNQRPSITAPVNKVIHTDQGVCYATNVDLGMPFIRDNCTPSEKIIITNDHPVSEIYPLGSTTIIWEAKDLVGNMEKATQTIIVQDKEMPEVTCPEDKDIVVDYDVMSAVVDYQIPFSDNCPGSTIVLESGFPSGTAFPLGETIVRHAITDMAEPPNVTICEFKVVVRHPWRDLELAINATTYEVCSGQSVTLRARVSGGTEKYVYSWTPRPWAGSVLEDYPRETTQYEVTVSDGLSSLTKSIEITVLETEPVILKYDGFNVNDILEGEEVVVNATPDFANYKFLINNEVIKEVGLDNQITFMAELGIYVIRVFATDANYCVSQDQLTIDIQSKRLPNVFTPNQDGKNEVFLENYTYEDLQVFSRAGELLYKGTTGWDGTHKGKLVPQGTYLYVVKRKMNNGEHRIYKGNVTLKL